MESEQDKLKRLLKKHPPLKDERSVEDVAAEQDSIRTEHGIDLSKVMFNLTDFLAISDPLVYNGKAIMMVRRPTMKEIKTMFPKDMLDNLDKLDTIPLKKAEEYDRRVFETMSLLITTPKLSVEQWEEKSNSILIKLFFEHLANVVKMVEPKISGF